MSGNIEKAILLLEENGFFGDKNGETFSKRIEDDHTLKFTFSPKDKIFVSSVHSPARTVCIDLIIDESFLNQFMSFLDGLTEAAIELRKINYTSYRVLEKYKVSEDEIILKQLNKTEDVVSLVLIKEMDEKSCYLIRRSRDINRVYYNKVLFRTRHERHICYFYK